MGNMTAPRMGSLKVSMMRTTEDNKGQQRTSPRGLVVVKDITKGLVVIHTETFRLELVERIDFHIEAFCAIMGEQLGSCSISIMYRMQAEPLRAT